MNLQTVHHLVHAYKMAPWRVQRQWIGGILLAVVLFAMIAALYLDVTARAAIAGRQIQDLTAAIRATQHTNADLQTHLAALTAVSVMEQRARDLGFRPVSSTEIEYVVVPGYVPPQPAILSAGTRPILSAPLIPPEYTQSLLDWLDEHLQFSGGGLP
jgi:hypothetical protein